MSDTALPVIFRFDTTANRTAFTPTPGVSEQLYVWLDSDDQPNAYYWDGAAWQLFNSGGASGITELTGDVTAGPGSGSQAATIAANAVSNTKLADMAALTTKVRAANSSGDPSDLAISDGETAKRVGTAMVSARFGWLSRSTKVPGDTSYTVPAGVYRIFVRGVGPGGGGGGADQSAAGSGVGGGGGAGGYFEKWLSVSPGDSFTIAVGAKGTGGAAGNNAGNPGTANTVFDSGGTPLTGNLGSGGASMAVGTSLSSSAGGAGGSASGTGATLVDGMTGGTGYRWASATILGGPGGNSMLGIGGTVKHGATATSATGRGAGGAGAMEFANQADRAGGDGADGVIIIDEFA